MDVLPAMEVTPPPVDVEENNDGVRAPMFSLTQSMLEASIASAPTEVSTASSLGALLNSEDPSPPSVEPSQSAAPMMIDGGHAEESDGLSTTFHGETESTVIDAMNVASDHGERVMGDKYFENAMR